MQKDLYEKVREALRVRSEQDPQERFANMVRRGAIDAQGRVLLRPPVASERSPAEPSQKD